MILDPSYRDDAFEMLESVPAHMKELRGEGTPIPAYMDLFSDALWANYQKAVTEYGMDAREAAYDALGSAICAIMRMEAEKK